MNNMKKQMDNYFAGLNLSLIRRQVKTYSKLVQSLDEGTLADLARCIANELNVNYEDERLSAVCGFLNDYINKEIGERTLFHCIIGACDTYSNDLPEYVLRVSHAVLESVYDVGEDDNECDCSTCGNMECEHRGAEPVATYDLTTVMKGILKGDTEIMDGDVKVPMEVILTVAKFMDTIDLEHDELKEAVYAGVFDGKIVETAKVEEVEEESEDTSSEPIKSAVEFNTESLRKAIEKTDELLPGSREKMLEATKELKRMGLDVEAFITDMLMARSKGTPVEISREDMAKIVKTVMTESN